MKGARIRKLSRLILQFAADQRLRFRVFGGAGVMLLCPTLPNGDLFRDRTGDLDLVGHASEQWRWQEFFGALGFTLSKRGSGLAQAQWQFQQDLDGEPCEIHVYSAPLKFSDWIPGPYFEPEWPYTVPAAVLLLSKLVIQRSADRNEQLKDIMALLFIFPLGRGPGPWINMDYLAINLRTGFSGWRRWYLAERVFQELELCLTQRNMSDPEGRILSAIVHSREAILGRLPSYSWRLAEMLHRAGFREWIRPVDKVEAL